MRRGEVLALAGVLAVLGLALTLRDGPEAAEPAPRGLAAQDLGDLRARAALDPCPPGLGPEVPDLVLPCLGGGPDVDLTAAPPGRPLLVNVWATWCRPCVAEVPELVAFDERHGDRVGVVGVLTQDTAPNGLEFSRQFSVRYPSVVDDGGVVMRAFSPGPPLTFLLAADGRVAGTKLGPFDSLEEVEAFVRDHLEGVL